MYPVELWMNPHGFLKAAQMPGANPKATWRWELGEMGRDGPTIIPEITDVVQITAPGGFKIDATINKEHMLQRMHTLVPDECFGDLNYEHEFTNESYIDVGNGIRVPDRLALASRATTTTSAAQNIQRRPQRVRRHDEGRQSATSAPTPSPCPTPSATTSPRSIPTMTRAGRRRLFAYERGSYKSDRGRVPAVDRGVRGAAQRGVQPARRSDAIVKQIPNKPIRYVVNSHQHSDAAGGLRAYSHIGATILTLVPQHHAVTARTSSTTQARTMKPDMVSQWPPTELAEGYYWEDIRENYTLEDQGRVMHVYYINPLQHAEGMLVGVPAEGKAADRERHRQHQQPAAGDADARHDDALQPGPQDGAGCPADRPDPRHA